MRAQVFYDSRCSLCRKEIAFYQRIDKKGFIHWIDLFDDTQRDTFPDSRESLLKVLHARGTDGRVHQGVAAFVVLWSSLPWPFHWLARLVSVPGIYRICEIAYAEFAKRRFQKLYCEID